MIHNTGLYLLEKNKITDGLKLLRDALTLIMTALHSSDISEKLMMEVQERYTNALTLLSSPSKDGTTTSVADGTRHRVFCVVEWDDLHRIDLSRNIMSSKTVVVVRLDEETCSEEKMDMISAVVLQNLASVHSCTDISVGPMQCQRSIELLLLSRSLQLRMIEKDSKSTITNYAYSQITTSHVAEALQLMTITLWRLAALHVTCGNDAALEQVHNELECVRQRFLYVLSRTENIFSFSYTCAPCA
jgi:hypothetical protein